MIVLAPFRGLALAALLAAPTLAQVDEGFVRAVRCPNEGFQPRVVVDPEGGIHLLYLRSAPAAADLFYVRSTDAGATFSEPIRVNHEEGTVDGSTAFRGAALARAADGTIHVVWLANERGGPDPARPPVVYARLPVGAQAFEAGRNLVQSRYGMDGTPAIALFGSNVHVFWHAPGDQLMPAEKESGKERGERSKAEPEPAPDPADAEPGAAAEAKPQPPLRQVWMTLSRDGGATFSVERAVDARNEGASSGCGMSAAVDLEGTLFVLYRTHLGRERGMRFLVSEDEGGTFEHRFVDFMRLAREMRSGSFLTLGPRGLLAAWESEGLVVWAKVRPDTDRIKAPMAPKDYQGLTSRPCLAENTKGGLLLAWFEGPQDRPGRLAWQIFAAVERRMVGSGKVEGVGLESAPAVVARPDDGFLIFY